MATYKLSKSFGFWQEAIRGVTGASRSLAQSDFPLLVRAGGVAEAFTIASAISNRATHGRKPLCVVEPLFGGSWVLTYSTASRTNTVRLTVDCDGTVQAEYEVRSSNSANESTAVESFLATGWTPSPELAVQLHRDDSEWEKFLDRFPEAEEDSPPRGHFGRPPF